MAHNSSMDAIKELLEKLDRKIDEQKGMIDSLHLRLDEQDEVLARHTELLETINLATREILGAQGQMALGVIEELMESLESEEPDADAVRAATEKLRVFASTQNTALLSFADRETSENYRALMRSIEEIPERVRKAVYPDLEKVGGEVVEVCTGSTVKNKNLILDSLEGLHRVLSEQIRRDVGAVEATIRKEAQTDRFMNHPGFRG